MVEELDHKEEAAVKEEEKREKEKFKKIGILVFLRNAREQFKGLDLASDNIETIVKTVEDGPEDFKKFVRKRGTLEFALHGGGPNQLDFDAKMVKWLMEQAGIDTQNAEYLKAGQKPSEGKLCFDFGGEQGIYFPGGLKSRSHTVVFDHHPPLDKESPFHFFPESEKQLRETSTQEMLFKSLAALGFFENKDIGILKKMVEFATQIDNKSHPRQFDRQTFEESWQTILGLYSKIQKLDNLYELFARGVKPTDKLFDGSDKDWLAKNSQWLNQLGLIYRRGGKLVNRPEERKKDVERGLAEVKEKADNGLVAEAEIGGKKLRFIVDYIADTDPEGTEIPLRVDASMVSGYAGVILYNEKTESYFINLDPRLEEELMLHTEDGVNVRGKMFIKNVNLTGPLETSLSKLLTKMGVDLSTVRDGLKKAIESNKKWMRTEIEEIKAEDLKTMMERQGNYWVLQPHGDKAKMGVIATNLPADFAPDPGVTYQFRIYQDTEPGSLKEGALLYKLIGFPVKKERRQPAAARSEQTQPRENRGEEKKESRENLIGREFYEYADHIIWFENKKDPGKSHWGLPSKPEEGKKHGVIVKGLPEGFESRKEPRGTRVWLRVKEDTRPDSEKEGVFLLEVIKIERPAGSQNEGDDKRGSRWPKEAKFESKSSEKPETKECEVAIFYNDGWKTILPDGQKVKLPEGIYDATHFYRIKLETSAGGSKIIEAVDTNKMTPEARSLISEHQGGRKKEPGDHDQENPAGEADQEREEKKGGTLWRKGGKSKKIIDF